MSADTWKLIVVAAAAFAIGVAGTLYFMEGTSQLESTNPKPAIDAVGIADEAVVPSPPATVVVPKAPPDPRLDALAVSKANDLIQFIPDADGKVIREIDLDPNSLGYRKPMREYSYAGDKVVALSAYHYYPDSTQITRIEVSYKADGSIDQYRETSSFKESQKKQPH